MYHQQFAPPEALQPIVKCFWYNIRIAGNEPESFEVMPDGYAEIIFHFGGPCDLISGGQRYPLPSPILIGLLNKPITLDTQSRFEVLGIRCFPWIVFDLLSLPADSSELRWLQHPISLLQPQLAALVHAQKITEAIELLKQYTLNLQSQRNIGRLLLKAGGAMRGARGALPVTEVAAAAHSTVRTLERKFKQAAGHTVKDVSDVMRFEKVRNQLWLFPDTNLAALAHETGYTDQSHLSREFKRYSGTTPAAFARKAKKEKWTVSQDLDIVAFVQSL